MKSKTQNSELRQKEVKSLISQLDQAKLKLAKLYQDLAIDKLKKTNQLGEQKKEIARIKTVIFEKMMTEVEKQEKVESESKPVKKITKVKEQNG